MTNLKAWMTAATSLEQETLAKEAGTSRRYLYQLASGVRRARPDLAARLEKAASPLRKASKGRLPRLVMVP